MKKISWLIQTNLLAEDQVTAFWQAANDAGCDTYEAIVIPFSDSFGNHIPSLENQFVIPYGSTKLTKLGMMNKWKGVFFNDNFCTTVWNNNRDDMLNEDCLVATVADVINHFKNINDDEIFFIRPINDLKEFNGTVTTVKEIRNWMRSVYSGSFSFGEDTIVSIANPVNIHFEWRYFIVGGKIVNGSIYKINNSTKLQIKEERKDILDIAQKMADIWLPHETCVMDIAKTEDGFKVIEFNCFNSSGTYKNDINEIVKTVVDYYSND